MKTRYCLIKYKHDTWERHFVKNVMQLRNFSIRIVHASTTKRDVLLAVL